MTSGGGAPSPRGPLAPCVRGKSAGGGGPGRPGKRGSDGHPAHRGGRHSPCRRSSCAQGSDGHPAHRGGRPGRRRHAGAGIPTSSGAASAIAPHMPPSAPSGVGDGGLAGKGVGRRAAARFGPRRPPPRRAALPRRARGTTGPCRHGRRHSNRRKFMVLKYTLQAPESVHDSRRSGQAVTRATPLDLLDALVNKSLAVVPRGAILFVKRGCGYARFSQAGALQSCLLQTSHSPPARNGQARSRRTVYEGRQTSAACP